MDLAMCDFALYDVGVKTSENRPLLMQEMVVLSCFPVFFSIMNAQLLWNQ